MRVTRAKRALIGTVTGAMVLGLLPAGAAFADINFSEVCEGAESAGFTDSGVTHRDAIDCMAAYDVVRGTSATTYGTTTDISRQQFASLVARFAVAAVPDLEIPTEDDPFTDVVSSTHGPSINALWNLGLIDGTSATTFSPNATLTRGQAATILFNAHVALGVEFPEDNDSDFTDLGDTHRDAIEALNAAEIFVGQSATVFGYSNPIQRGQIASALARSAQVLLDNDIWESTLVEAGLEAGLSLELSATAAFINGEITATATLLDNDLAGVEAERVAFLVLDEDDDAVAFSGNAAALDTADPQTNPNGQVEFDIDTGQLAAGDYTVAVWTGDIGTDDLDDADDFAVATLSLFDGAEAVSVSTLGDDFKVPFGTTDVVDAQLVDGDDDAVAAGGVRVLLAVYNVQTNGLVSTTESETSADGSVSFEVSSPAVPADETDRAYGYLVVADTSGDGEFGEGDVEGFGETTFSADEAGTDPTAVVTTTQSTSPVPGVAAALVNGQLTVTATLTDVYGNPAAGRQIEFDNDLLLSPVVRTTNANGVASYTYTGPAVTGAPNSVAVSQADEATAIDFGDESVVTEAHAFGISAVAATSSIDSLIWGRSGNAVDLVTAGTNAEPTAFARFAWDAGSDQFFINGAAATPTAFATAVGNAVAADTVQVSARVGGVRQWNLTVDANEAL